MTEQTNSRKIIGNSRVKIIDIKNLYLTQEQIEEEKRKIQAEMQEEEKEQPIITQPENLRNVKPEYGMIYVPSLGLYVSKNKFLQGKNWNQCQGALHSDGARMPTIPEFVEFLKYLRANPNGVADANSAEVRSILDEILTVRSPWRAEWLDADFKSKNNKLFVYYHAFENGQIIKKTDELEDYLAQDRIPRIDLNSWLNNPTKQGLPKKNIAKGDIYYCYPRKDFNSVAGFSADSGREAYLNCCRDAAIADVGLGVRFVCQRK